ncbi:hypothetical protein L6452_28316 [Arctium lappa]|uniref:Uncharacterized protein n=1 Tax=Arctium lappa TaxID=4217 RepID=A0ACB8ZZF9_ARCLA|nr:hypothetical protein L6452_28316 [Arctium lappa]
MTLSPIASYDYKSATPPPPHPTTTKIKHESAVVVKVVAIPEDLSKLPSDKLNLSHNNFSVVLPNFGGSKFGLDSFEGNNPSLCSRPLKLCKPRSSGGLSSGAVAGIVISLMTGVVVFALLLIGYSQGKQMKNFDEEFERGE